MTDIENINIYETDCNRCRRKEYQDYTNERKINEFSEDEIVHEARRCLYCADPNCMTGCPTQLDIKRMVHAAGERNFYEAARVALTANPLALSCGRLCGADNYCKSTCNLAKTHTGAIKINEIQRFVLERFREYRLDVSFGKEEKINKKIAVIGAGPAGLSLVAFLARMNFESIDLYEKDNVLGGVLVKEIPYFRIPKEDTDFEINLIKSYPNVHIHLNENIDSNRINELSKSHDAVYLAIGRQNLYKFEDTVTAKEFHTDINREFKLKEEGFKSKYRDLTGKRVLVLGSGDVAVDCAETAKKHGAKEVVLVMREDIRTATCQKQSMLEVIRDNIEILPSLLPVKLQKEGNEITGIWCKDLVRPENGDRLIPGDLIICAFGCGRNMNFLPNMKVETNGKVLLDGKETNIFTGGDFRLSFSIVEAVNDSKNSALNIYKYLMGKEGKIPRFSTVVDDVDLSVTMDGIKYINPFGISSAPVSGTYEHLKRCFENGFGFALTKTYPLEKDIQKNNHIRIVKVYDSPESTSYNNIVMISEHSHNYWLESIRKLKKEFPDRIVVASIMCMDNEEDWRLLSKLTEEAGADALELNFSCPNECHGNDGSEGGCEGGFKSKNAMAMAIGVDPKAIERCTRYVTSTVKIPVYPKLTPNVQNIEELAAAALRGGAAGISTINTVFGISQITLSGHPWPQVGKNQNTISGGLSGDLVRPIAIRQIAQVLRYNEELKGHVMGIGGVRNADTAMQLIYTGASIVQMCSSVQKYSYQIVEEIISGVKFILYCWSRKDLRAYLHSQGVESFMPEGARKDFWNEERIQDRKVPTLEEVRGIALKHIGERKILEGPETWRVNAKIDETKCLGCGSCALSCRDNSTTAIYKDGRVYKVDPEKCIGCALCSSVCPVRAISYVQVKGLNDMTPEEMAKIPTAF